MLQSLMNNWHLKLLSLMFAVVLWLFIVGEQKLERGFSVPLELKNLPEGMMVTSEVPSHIDVRISGPRTLLVNQDSDQLSIGIDLKDLKEGITTFRRLEDRINLPGGMRVSRLSPSYVDIKLEEVLERVIVPEVVLEGKLAKGLEIEEIVVAPESVKIVGARSEILKVREVKTEPVVLGEQEGTFTIDTPLQFAAKFSRVLPGSVEVTVVVKNLSSSETPGRNQP